MELAIGATDLAESLGSAVALNLLFHIPMSWAIVITAFDVLLLLALAGAGHENARSGGRGLRGDHRGLLWHRDFRAAADPAQLRGDGPGSGAARAFGQSGMLVVAIGIIGATVMPHNLYLHSALVQSRKLQAR